ncbi:MAG: metal-dependent hydrolase [Nevskiales bacterium]
MLPLRRNFRFRPPPDRIKAWHPMGPQVSHLLNALSIFFPVGERFFIHSVRHYRDRIGDAELQQAVTAFIGQEALHGREHERYNRALLEAGLPVERLEAQVAGLLETFKRRLPPAAQLSVTIALEHVTAIFADLLLKEPSIVGGGEPHLATLWRWHALEETEHKSVAFDVYERAVGRDTKAYALRCLGLCGASLIFFTLIARYQRQLVKADPQARGWSGWAGLSSYLFGSPGALRRLAAPWLGYFRRDFHPWDYDNRAFLAELDKFNRKLEALPLPIAA